MTEYTLYPINNNNVDWPLYHLVAHFMKNSYHLDGITVGDGQTELFKPFDDDAVQEKRSYEYKLVFPNEELTVSYPEEILDQEVVVLKSYIPIEHMVEKAKLFPHVLSMARPVEYQHRISLIFGQKITGKALSRKRVLMTGKTMTVEYNFPNVPYIVLIDQLAADVETRLVDIKILLHLLYLIEKKSPEPRGSKTLFLWRRVQDSNPRGLSP